MNGKNVFTFIAGAAIGSLVTWKLLDAKYKQIADEAIESTKERFLKWKADILADSTNSKEEPKVEEKKPYEKPDIMEYAAMIDKLKYEEKGGGEPMTHESPYVIPPDEFDEMDDYEACSYTYYADNVLTDDFGKVVEDIENTVGIDSLKHFGEYEDYSVFVRNDILKTDYEILLDNRKYSDVNAQSPVDEDE